MSGIRKDLSGKRFGRLVAIKISNKPSSRSLWTCQCDCGKIHDVLAQSLIPGIQKSCGCLRDEVASATGKSTATHGMTRTPRWSTWNRMLRFAKSKGIRVCHGLRSHPDAIFDILPEKPIKHTVRLINDSGYFSCGVCASCNESEVPINVRWGRESRSDKKAKIDLSGVVIGRLTAIEYAGDGYWKFKCSCGNDVVAESNAVKSGRQKSCGCAKNEFARDLGLSSRKHGLSKTSIGNIWSGMKSRCYDKQHHAYHNYGGRGIVVCRFIKESPESIIKVAGERPTGTSIDRINNNANYSCGECTECVENGWTKNIHWATASVQARNTRRTRLVTIHGKTMCLRDWAREIGILENSLRVRLKKGWCDDDLVRPRLIPGVALG